GCPACGSVLGQYLPLLAGRVSPAAAPPLPEEIYDGALSRAVDSIRRLGLTLPAVETPEQRKQEVVDRLAVPGVARLREVPGSMLGIPLVEALLERSWTLRHEDPATALELARCAVQVAEGLRADDANGDDARELTDLRCRAAIELGNAHRVADELDAAE